jgi:hypothetical protein
VCGGAPEGPRQGLPDSKGEEAEKGQDRDQVGSLYMQQEESIDRDQVGSLLYAGDKHKQKSSRVFVCTRR